MSDYEDEFNDFTEEDWAQIDAICEAAVAHTQAATTADALDTPSDGQYSQIAHEQPTDIVSAKVSTPAEKPTATEPAQSPYTRFRHGYLTVTDIVAPAW